MKVPDPPQRTTSGFSFSIVERSLLEGIAARKFGKAEMSEVLRFFGEDPPVCVYCGAIPVQRWDHLTPVAKGGDTTLGNLVPACARCDDSKRDLPFEVWALSDAPNSPRTRGIQGLDSRLTKIREYVAKHGYRPRAPEERLTSHEWQQFEQLRRDLQELRARFDAFIKRYRKRAGLR